MGVLDVSINSHAIAVESVAGSPQMGFCHSMYAVGQLFGPEEVHSFFLFQQPITQELWSVER